MTRPGPEPTPFQSRITDARRRRPTSPAREGASLPGGSTRFYPYGNHTGAARSPEAVRLGHAIDDEGGFVFTPIHRALGLEPQQLTAELIQQAVEQCVEETADLDWKQAVYSPQDPQWQDEAAKDIAAMANSGGGWLVFGVREEDGTSNGAAEITPVAWGSKEQQRILQVAYSRIGPPVTGLDFHPIAVNGGHVVVVRIPASTECPHFARKGKDAFLAPQRNGPHTAFMGDREIERAFRLRFQGYEDRERILQALYEEAALPIEPASGVALVAAFMPHEPRLDGFQLQEGQARSLFQDTMPGEMVDAQSAQSWFGVWFSGRVRRGLRRWSFAPDRGSAAFAKSVLEDGTILAAYQLGNLITDRNRSDYYPVGRPNDCMASHLEQAVVDGVALLRTYAKGAQIQGGYRVRIGLVGHPGNPIFIRTTEGFDNLLRDVSSSVPIHRFHPVTFDLNPLDTVDALLSDLRQAALDLVNQGGIKELTVIAASRASSSSLGGQP